MFFYFCKRLGKEILVEDWKVTMNRGLGSISGISPQNMARNMVLTYLRVLDPGDLPLTEDGKKPERCRHLGGESAAQAGRDGSSRYPVSSGDNNGIVMGLVGKFMGNYRDLMGN